MRFLLLLLLLLPSLALGEGLEGVKSWAYQLQNAKPDEFKGFSLVVLDPSDVSGWRKGALERLKSQGVIPLAYLSVGEAEDYRAYWKRDWKENPPKWLGPENRNWKGNYAVKYWYPRWKGLLFKEVDRILKMGFEGIYLDRVDQFLYWSEERGLLSKREAAKRMALLVKELSRYCKERASVCYVVPQNGVEILKFAPWLVRFVDGWSAESLFFTDGRPTPKEEFLYALKYYELLKERGKLLLSVEYLWDPKAPLESLTKLRFYYFEAKRAGFVPYGSTVDRQLAVLVVVPSIQPPERR